MIQGTTPTHTFNITLDTTNIAELLITYAQFGKVVLRKEKADCTIDGNSVAVKLTQEDTFLFDDTGAVEIQIRCKDNNQTVFASDIIRVDCKRCLTNEVL